MKKIVIFTLLSFLFLIPKAYASGSVKVFNYKPDKIFKIYSKPYFSTDFKFKTKILAYSLGDTVRWLAQPVMNNLFVKPIEKHLETSLSVITQNHTYEFLLSSQNPNFYQLVEFRHPKKIAFVLAKNLEKKIKKRRQVFDTGVKKLTPEEISKIKFDYIISGNKSIRPVQVFRFHGFVYLFMPKKLQSMPAFFIMNGGKLDLVNYIVRGRYIVVERLFDKGALKLGNKEAFIYKKSKNNGGFNW
jgi:type IV secretion system protein VirB9